MSKDSFYNNHANGRILLLGNSVNLVAGKNVHLKYQSVIDNFVVDNQLQPSFFSECRKLSPTFVHHALSELRKHVVAYYTTNYDYAMEIALKPKFPDKSEKIPPVKHIHGEANKPNECVFFDADYTRLLAELQHKDWYDGFHRNEIHIVGLSLRKEERVLYYLMQERRDKIEALPDFKYDNTIKPIYAWLTYEEHEKQETEKLAENLRKLSVVPILIPIYNKNYISAWEQILGKFILHCNNIHVSKAECKALKSAKTPQLSTRNLNINYSASRCLKYPERVHFKILKPSLHRHSTKAQWYFYCEIDLCPRIWSVPICSLLQIANSYPHSRHIHLYLDYREGTLFAKNTPNAPTATEILTCTAIQGSQIPDTY